MTHIFGTPMNVFYSLSDFALLQIAYTDNDKFYLKLKYYNVLNYILYDQCVI